jgi:type IV pilus assembly protein PilA
MRWKRRPRRGFTLIEILIAVAIISLLLAVAIPPAMSAHRHANELTVMREVQTIFQGQLEYMSQFGEFASTLTQLGPPASGVGGPQAAKLIPASLASGDRNGYLFTLQKTRLGFAVNANPKVFGRDGSRTFYIDEDGILRQNWSAQPATVESAEVQGPH